MRNPTKICGIQPRQYSEENLYPWVHILNKLGRAEVNELGMQIKKLESKQIKNPQIKNKLETVKIKAEINRVESKITIE